MLSSLWCTHKCTDKFTGWWWHGRKLKNKIILKEVFKRLLCLTSDGFLNIYLWSTLKISDLQTRHLSQTLRGKITHICTSCQQCLTCFWWELLSFAFTLKWLCWTLCCESQWFKLQKSIQRAFNGPSPPIMQVPCKWGFGPCCVLAAGCWLLMFTRGSPGFVAWICSESQSLWTHSSLRWNIFSAEATCWWSVNTSRMISGSLWNSKVLYSTSTRFKYRILDDWV